MSSSTPAGNRTIAVISAFRPPADLPERVAALRTQVHGVVVVDDGSASARDLAIEMEGVELIELPENRGIAAALNVGIERARELGATHVLTLDQDSVVPPGYVDSAMASLRSHAGRRVAGVVPARVEGEVVTTIGAGDRPLDPIQSGQVLVVDAFGHIGPFDERLVIDAVDSEFTLRARRHGFELYTMEPGELGHSLGDLTPLIIFGAHRSVLGRPRYWRYHAPFRTYYMVRNGLALWRLHARGNIGWLIRRTAYLIVDVTYTSLASPDRAAQFTAVAHALRDVLRWRLGKIPAATVELLARRGEAARKK